MIVAEEARAPDGERAGIEDMDGVVVGRRGEVHGDDVRLGLLDC